METFHFIFLPFRNLPLCIITSVLLVLVVYLMVNISYFAILNKEEYLSSWAVAAVRSLHFNTLTKNNSNIRYHKNIIKNKLSSSVPCGDFESSTRKKCTTDNTVAFQVNLRLFGAIQNITIKNIHQSFVT